ncbi:MAG: hypothetical protein WBD00_04400 [Candidatus Omnitrophota bacterium]
MKRPVLLALLFVFLLGGCTTISTDVGTFLGMGPRDLEKAKANGKVKVFSLSYDDAFSKVTAILEANNLKIYQTDRNRGYIVAIGFPRQTDTTRVGIFFESDGDNKTKITLSSLSTTALIKAESIIFGNIEGNVTVID